MRKKQNNAIVRRRANIDNRIRSNVVIQNDAISKKNNPPELQRQKIQAALRRRQNSYVAILLVIFVIILGVFTISQYTSSVTTIKYDASDSSLRTNDEKYRKLVDEYLAAHPSDRLDFLRQEENFSNFMIKNAPEVASAKLTPELLFGGRLQVAFRSPVAVWESPGGRQYVDSTGHIFSENYMLEPSVVIKDESGLDLEGVQTVAPSSLLSFIGRVISRVNSEPGIGQVESVTIPLGAIRYLELGIAGRPYVIKVQTDRNADNQADDIVNIIKYLDSKQIVPKNYIDVRVKGKAYYK